MSPKDWGPPLWLFFHTLAEKVDETKFDVLGPQIFNLIRKICSCLPCPDCSNHATTFLNKVKMNTISTKENLKMMLFYFHNTVNKRTNKPVFPGDGLSIYSTYSLPKLFVNFTNTYNKRLGNLRLMNDSLQRKNVIIFVSGWLKTNHMFFN
jgi:hypothetical protein